MSAIQTCTELNSRCQSCASSPTYGFQYCLHCVPGYSVLRNFYTGGQCLGPLCYNCIAMSEWTFDASDPKFLINGKAKGVYMSTEPSPSNGNYIFFCQDPCVTCSSIDLCQSCEPDWLLYAPSTAPTLYTCKQRLFLSNGYYLISGGYDGYGVMGKCHDSCSTSTGSPVGAPTVW